MANLSSLFLALSIVATAMLAEASNTALGVGKFAQVAIDGQVFCTDDGNVDAGDSSPGVNSADVFFNCNGGSTQLSNATTNTEGLFSTTIKIGDIAFNETGCFIEIPLPVNNCVALPSSGALQAVPVFVSAQLTNLGLTANFTNSPYVVVA